MAIRFLMILALPWVIVDASGVRGTRPSSPGSATSQRAFLVQESVRTAPNVEAKVAEQQMEDVQIHDEFSKEAEEDTEIQQSVEDNHDLRP
mmetsp:Transcript_13758/g.27162  ORF Transcript_13758/g.27162 Transcript_13758/m.27162 type:complete len:91 (+) Transcript_13758:67-339(+)